MADPKDILRQYGPDPLPYPEEQPSYAPPAPPSNDGFLFSVKDGQLKFNPWESLKSFMGSGHSPGYLSTSGNAQPIRDAFDTAGWVGMPGLGLNYAGMMPTNALGSAGGKLASKSATVAPRELDDLGFYSAALEGAKSWPMERGSPQQALAHLKKSGTKDAEIAATGLDKYLAEQDVISRQALETYLRENRVKVERDLYGGVEPDTRITAMERNALDDGLIEHIYEDERGRSFYITEDRDAGNVYVQGPQGRTIEAPGRMNEQNVRHGVQAIQDWIEQDARIPGVKDVAQYADYSGDPSNPAYRESILRLKMPERLEELRTQQQELFRVRDKNDSLAASVGESTNEGSRYRDLAREANDRAFEIGRDIAAIRGQYMQNGHFDGPGIISHSQMAMQPDIDGRNWMTPWQVQSDWGQAIRTNQHDAAARDLFQKSFKRLTQEERAEVSKAIRSDPGRYPPGRNEDKIREVERRASTANMNLASAINAGHQHLKSILPDGASLEPMSAHGTAKYLMAKGHEFLKAGDVDNARRAFELETAIHEAQKAYNLIDPELRAATSAAPANPMVNTTDQWVTTQLRNVLQHAAKEDAHGIALPRGETVLTYNPGDEHGMAGFYDNILQRAMAKEMRRLDPSIKGPEEVRLLPHTEANNKEYMLKPEEARLNDSADLARDLIAQHAHDYGRTAFERPFYGYPLTEKAKEEIRKGLPLFQQGIPVADLLRAYYGDEKE